MNKFLYLDTELCNIQEKQYLRIYLLELEKKIVFKIYKPYTKDLAEKIKDLKQFTNLSQNVFFAIKRDGKLSLDINI